MAALSPRGWVARLLFVAALALGVLAPATAWAQDNYPPSTTVTTGGCSGTNADPRVCGTNVQGSNAGVASSSLPFTGGDVALLTVLGIGAAGGGIALLMLGRRRSRTAA